MSITAFPAPTPGAVQTTKILAAKTQLTQGSLQTIYTAPSPGGAVITNLTLNNSALYPCSVYVYLRVAGAAQANKQLIRYGWKIPSRATRTINLDICLGPGDVLSVLYQFAGSGSSDLNVCVFGQEWTGLTNVVPKILGQLNVAASTSGTIYQVPAGKAAILNRIVVVNPNSNAIDYYLSGSPASGTPTAYYLSAVNIIPGYGSAPEPNDVEVHIDWPGITLGALDTLDGQAQAGTGANGLTFQTWGYELTL